MSEEINANTANTTAPVSVSNQSTTMKDAMIPLSIIIAGLFVGAGLYFGGGSGASQPLVPSNGSPTEVAADNTGKVSPVTEDDHIRGSISAKIKIVEFSDFDCPFCSRFHDVMNSVIEKYSEDEVAWVYRHFPLEQLHPQAPAVALASECVAKLGGNDAFWKFTDDYFSVRGNGDTTTHSELIPKLVTQAGVNSTDFKNCFESEEFKSEVQSDMNNAVETGGRGTPWSIIIGPTGKTYSINGSLPQAAVEQMIEVAKQEA